MNEHEGDDLLTNTGTGTIGNGLNEFGFINAEAGNDTIVNMHKDKRVLPVQGTYRFAPLDARSIQLRYMKWLCPRPPNSRAVGSRRCEAARAGQTN